MTSKNWLSFFVPEPGTRECLLGHSVLKIWIKFIWSGDLFPQNDLDFFQSYKNQLTLFLLPQRQLRKEFMKMGLSTSGSVHRFINTLLISFIIFALPESWVKKEIRLQSHQSRVLPGSEKKQFNLILLWFC